MAKVLMLKSKNDHELPTTLILGSGGREHALALGLLESGLRAVYVYPGNDGMFLNKDILPLKSPHNSSGPAYEAQVGFKTEEEMHNLATLAAKKNVTLVIVGPEDLLARDISTIFRSHNIDVLGPSAKACQLESSKAYAKKFMSDFGIKTAAFKVADNYQSALLALSQFKNGAVIKADELWAGKGVFVVDNFEQGAEVLAKLFLQGQFTIRPKKVVIEEKLVGEEFSALALTDGHHYFLMGIAQDHKRAHDGDQGPNTGGMGTLSAPDLLDERSREQIFAMLDKTLFGLKKRELDYQGVLFLGLMKVSKDENNSKDNTKNKINEGQLYLLEYNCRFGDPETQVIVPALKNRFLDLCRATINNQLSTYPKDVYQLIGEKVRSSYVHVVMASGRYPDNEGLGMALGKNIILTTERGKQIISAQNANLVNHCWPSQIIFAGVKNNSDGNLQNSGGRILGVTAAGNNLAEARDRAYQLITRFQIEESFYRKDIGLKKMQSMRPLRLAILASGEGQNAEAILEWCSQYPHSASVKVVITDKPNAGVIARAQKYGVPVWMIEAKYFANRKEHEEAILRRLDDFKVELPILAGYMRILSPHFLCQFPVTHPKIVRFLQSNSDPSDLFKWKDNKNQLSQVINIHPGKLPDFKGAHAFEDSFSSGVKEGTISVHLVDGLVDHGPVLFEGTFVRKDEDTFLQYKAKGREIEKKMWPLLLTWLTQVCEMETQPKCQNGYRDVNVYKRQSSLETNYQESL